MNIFKRIDANKIEIPKELPIIPSKKFYLVASVDYHSGEWCTWVQSYVKRNEAMKAAKHSSARIYEFCLPEVVDQDELNELHGVNDLCPCCYKKITHKEEE
jgi:hypothetical protein